MYYMLLLLLFGSSSLQLLSAVKRVGIVGGGVGGTATAYFLRQLGGDHFQIDLFEKEAELGGRLALQQVNGQWFESGGSIIHTRNKLAMRLIDEFGLKRCSAASSDTFGITDGNRVLFSSSGAGYWLTMMKLLWRYGYDVYRLHGLVGNLLDKFSRIYGKLDTGETFDTVENLVRAMDTSFIKLISVQLRQYLKVNGMGDLIIDELVAAATRVNYGQSTNIHALVGMVSVAGTVGDLTCVASGNRQLAERAFQASAADLVHERVVQITRSDDGLYIVDSLPRHLSPSENTTAEPTQRVYDVVVLATPMTSDHEQTVRVRGVSEPVEFIGEYLPLRVTFVQAERKESVFSAADDVMCNEMCEVINSVGLVHPLHTEQSEGSRTSHSVYKLFSSARLSRKWLEQHVFGSVGDGDVTVSRVSWLAYPRYPLQPLALETGQSAAETRHWLKSARFRLADRLFYTNAVEVAASAIEMSLIAALNVANGVCASVHAGSDGGLCRHRLPSPTSAHEEL